MPKFLVCYNFDQSPSTIYNRYTCEDIAISHGGNAEMKQIVAVIFGLGLLCNALLFVPQALAVWRKKTDEGVSLITFGGFSVLQAIGIVHGIYQHDLSLILGMSASLLSCGTVTLLTLIYRIRRKRGLASQ
jgi:MtN3 and saliva related transmembrane protein